VDARLQRRVQRYGWDRAAGDYERSWSAQLAPAQSLALEMAALAPGERVVDIACGTGLVSIPAARAITPGGELVGTDISQVMVETAALRAADAGVPKLRFSPKLRLSPKPRRCSP
jgi:ubiquinone/menaquinone biosynthesis C-methylase UbiE